MLIEELERVEGLRGPGIDPVEKFPPGVTDWEHELEAVRLALDAEQLRHAAETRLHEETVHDLLRRKANALAALTGKGNQ